jgi:hypothetical protein
MDYLFHMITTKVVGDGAVTIPIKKIHGLGVEVQIEKRTRDKDGIVSHCYSFTIKDDYYRGDSDYKFEYYQKHYHYNELDTDEKIKVMLECCVRFIKKCRIDKFRGRFALENFDSTNCLSLAMLFENIEHVELPFSKCCVCDDWTSTVLTDCSHPVCMECLPKLVKKDCEQCHGSDPLCECDNCCGLEKVAPCPLCRKPIISGIQLSS